MCVFLEPVREKTRTHAAPSRTAWWWSVACCSCSVVALVGGDQYLMQVGTGLFEVDNEGGRVDDAAEFDDVWEACGVVGLGWGLVGGFMIGKNRAAAEAEGWIQAPILSDSRVV